MMQLSHSHSVALAEWLRPKQAAVAALHQAVDHPEPVPVRNSSEHAALYALASICCYRNSASFSTAHPTSAHCDPTPAPRE